MPQFETLSPMAESDFNGMLNLGGPRRQNPAFNQALLRTKRFLEGRDPLTNDFMPTVDWEYRMKKLMTGEASYSRMIGMREAVGIDNFPLMFGTALDRELQARYKVAPAELRKICKARPVRDFRNVDVYRSEGLTGPLQKKDKGGAYKADNYMTEAQIQWKLDVYGKIVELDWEAYLNDDLGMFNDIPARLADSAMNTDNYLITSKLVDSSGPLDATFEITTATAALSISSIAAAVSAMIAQTLDTAHGTIPILTAPKYLMVPPQLALAAKTFLQSPGVLYAATASTAVPLPSMNIAGDVGLELLVNPWLPLINTTSGTTNWFLISDPSELPIIELGSLRGYENPDLFMRAPDSVRASGGAANAFDGSFDFDKVAYKMRYPLQATVVNTKAGYASTGAGG
jgi:hypothetical protein